MQLRIDRHGGINFLESLATFINNWVYYSLMQIDSFLFVLK